MKDEDASVLIRASKGDSYDLWVSEELYLLGDDGTIQIDRMIELDEALKNVRVADPAVGSGAFPLGMLNEIVRARQNITTYLDITQKIIDPKGASREIRYRRINERSARQLKYDTIRNSIFAVDLEPSAVDIARLRLWLALVIDDEIDPKALTALDGHRNPLPLPNLECNILCGNSLIDEFEGIKLVNESELLGNTTLYSSISLYQSAFNASLQRLIAKQKELFSCDRTDKKEMLLREIDELRDSVILSQLEGASFETLSRYEETKTMASKPFVLWQLDFARVFIEKGGFDIVIGNPPYIQLQKTINEQSKEKLGDAYEKLGYESFAKTGDIYCLFYEKGFHLLHEDGILAFITSNKWMRASYGEKLRGLFARYTNPINLIDFAGQKVFDSATVDVNILIFSKGENKGNTLACVIREKGLGNLSVYVIHNGNRLALNSCDAWIINSPIEESIKCKINSVGVPLGKWNVNINFGIKTGYNEAFIISSVTRDRLIASDPNSAELIRPILRGRDIQRFGYTFADLWLINVHNGLKDEGISPIDVNDYPAIKQHLDFFYSKLEKRADKGVTPYNLRNCAYLNDFSKPKIIWKRIGSKLRFSYDESGVLCLDSTCFATGSSIPYLVSVLNSTMGNYLLKDSPKTGTGDLIISVQALEPARVPLLSEDEQTPYEDLLNAILRSIQNGEDYSCYEAQLDSLVFDAYNLTKEERLYVIRTVEAMYR